MNHFLAKIPLVRLLIPLVIGIAVAYSFRFQITTSFFCIAILICILLLFLQRNFLKFSLRWIGLDGLIISIALFFVGVELTSLEMKTKFSSPLNSTEKVLGMNVRLLVDPVVKEKSVKLFLELLSWKENSSWKAGEEKIMIYLERDANAEKLKYGDEILIHASPEFVDGPKNPEEFDYRSWLEREGVRGQAYVKTGEWQLTNRDCGNWFKKCALDLRRYFLAKLKTYGLSGSAFGVSAALLLGASDYLDPGTLEAYSASGTLHVLTVSGMHVALVYLVLLKLIAPLQRRKGGKWCSIIIQLLFLWFYATLTGMCPSALRAVTMLTVVISGRAFNKKAHILNSLAASAWIMLVCDPLSLFEIGFQLSFIAVGGIVIIQPKFEKMVKPKFWFTKQIWSLISVSIVAQIFTFPIALYYFHEFPTYFLLANVFIIPLSIIAMYIGLFLLIVSPFALLAKPIAVVFGFFVELLNGSVTWIEHLPHAVLHSAKWEQLEIFLLYLFIVSMLVFLLHKNKMWLQTGFASFLILLFFVASEKNIAMKKRELVFFDVNHCTAIAVVNGNDNVLFADTSLLKRQGDIDFHIEPCLKATGMKNEKIIPLMDSISFENDFVHEEKKWLFADKKKIVLVDRKFNRNGENVKCDILLLQQNTNAKLDSLIEKMKPNLILADGSDGKKKILKWKEICAKRNVKFYDVQQQGALVIEE